MMEGLIIKNISDLYRVKSQDGYFECKAKGIFRKKNIIPTVGDKVLFDKEKLIITDILDRKNILVRPPIANVDQALIVMSTINPTFSTYLIDKLLNVIEFNNIKPIICITKLDLLHDKTIDKYINYYRGIGYEVILNTNIDDIKKVLKNKITVLTGQSGVGKSTLLNKLNFNLNLKTNDISYALGRGKHTTRHTEIYEVCDGYIADTPGFSSLLLNMKKEDIRDNMVEFNNYKDKCKYRDCMHLNEDECEIKRLVKEGTIISSRYENYIKFISEIKSIY
ncbi:MAG: ribosome small subunit-dependent GTPase A [Bacilli bacterium]|nr:ribosome small subunit-dependent GTPase A [Bacilli bacterium]